MAQNIQDTTRTRKVKGHIRRQGYSIPTSVEVKYGSSYHKPPEDQSFGNKPVTGLRKGKLRKGKHASLNTPATLRSVNAELQTIDSSSEATAVSNAASPPTGRGRGKTANLRPARSQGPKPWYEVHIEEGDDTTDHSVSCRSSAAGCNETTSPKSTASGSSDATIILALPAVQSTLVHTPSPTMSSSQKVYAGRRDGPLQPRRTNAPGQSTRATNTTPSKKSRKRSSSNKENTPPNHELQTVVAYLNTYGPWVTISALRDHEDGDIP